jgi:3-dehydroquinate dehydratase
MASISTCSRSATPRSTAGCRCRSWRRAWAHYSYAFRDALELLTAPIVEVHLSNIDEREEWRRTSVLSDLAAKRVVGKGPDGYREALAFLVDQTTAAE